MSDQDRSSGAKASLPGEKQPSFDAKTQDVLNAARSMKREEVWIFMSDQGLQRLLAQGTLSNCFSNPEWSMP